jgi:hypothetical protein
MTSTPHAIYYYRKQIRQRCRDKYGTLHHHYFSQLQSIMKQICKVRPFTPYQFYGIQWIQAAEIYLKKYYDADKVVR